MAKSKEVKVWRVGNFVVRLCDVPTFGKEDWLLSENQVRQRVKKGDIGTVECFEVCSLDGAWMTRVMPGSQMHLMVEQSLVSDDGREWLELVFTNMMQVSTIPNGYYHQGLLLLTAAYYDPTLISGHFLSQKKRRFMRDVDEVCKSFLKWYAEAEKEREALRISEEEFERRYGEAYADAVAVSGKEE